jgi:hypothetical protein
MTGCGFYLEPGGVGCGLYLEPAGVRRGLHLFTLSAEEEPV